MEQSRSLGSVTKTVVCCQLRDISLLCANVTFHVLWGSSLFCFKGLGLMTHLKCFDNISRTLSKYGICDKHNGSLPITSHFPSLNKRDISSALRLFHGLLQKPKPHDTSAFVLQHQWNSLEVWDPWRTQWNAVNYETFPSCVQTSHFMFSEALHCSASKA